MGNFLKSVIFDFDGLILDTEWPEVQAWSELYQNLQIDVDPQWWTFSIGRGPDQDPKHPFEFIPRDIRQTLDKNEVIAERWDRRRELVEKEAPLAGVSDLLEALRSSQIRIGLASSSSQNWVKGHLKRLDLIHYFAAIACAEDVKLTKPSPDLYLKALEDLDCQPENGLALEDSPAGCQSALAAGLRVIAVPNRLTSTMQFPPVQEIWSSLSGKQPADLARILQ